jgi:cytochrome c-type biogenesis protein CcmF
LLFNNILLVIAAALVFVGTLAPLVSDALGLGTLSVGAQYFNPTFLLPVLPLLALVSIGIHSKWKRGRLTESKRTLWQTFVASVVVALLIVYGAYGSGGTWITPIGMILGVWIIASSLIDPIDRWRRKLSVPRAVFGMTLAHVAVGIFVISITAVESYTIERDVAMQVGESAEFGRYTYRLDSVVPAEGPNYDAVRAEITILRDGRELGKLRPEKRAYWVQRQVMTEAGIDIRWNKDIFAALGEDLGAGRWSIRAQIRPLINYVWLAAFLMALGGAIAATDRRYRAATVTERESSGAEPAIESARP